MNKIFLIFVIIAVILMLRSEAFKIQTTIPVLGRKEPVLPNYDCRCPDNLRVKKCEPHKPPECTQPESGNGYHFVPK